MFQAIHSCVHEFDKIVNLILVNENDYEVILQKVLSFTINCKFIDPVFFVDTISKP